jgi:hypothetical protein
MYGESKHKFVATTLPSHAFVEVIFIIIVLSSTDHRSLYKRMLYCQYISMNLEKSVGHLIHMISLHLSSLHFKPHE